MLLASLARAEGKAPGQPVKTLTSMDALDNFTRLKPGDVNIEIVEDKHKAVNQLIAVTGEIQAPYVGFVKAEGLTCRKLAYKLKGELEKGIFKVATVFVKRDPWDEPLDEKIAYRDRTPYVVIFGSLAKQGKFDLNSIPNQKLSGLLNLAGAHFPKLRAPKIHIVRRTPQGNKRILVNTWALLFEKRMEYDLFLRRDDVVIVD